MDADKHDQSNALRLTPKKVLMEPPQIYVERTLALVKPDAVSKSPEIEDIILRSGFTILQKRRVHLTPEQASDFYAEHYGKLFFPSLVAFMSSGATVALLLARTDAIDYWRELIGPTNTVKARQTHPDSLRALYGTDDQRNGFHGSSDVRQQKERFDFSSLIQFSIPSLLVKQLKITWPEQSIQLY
jgi:nucleoside-diphosphate kinase